MRDEVATLHERMSQGGDWMRFRDEIAALHAQDNTEEEYVALLRGHHLLILLIDEVYQSETAAKFHAIAEAEYRMFLNKEAMQGENINPVLLERITRREIEIGRLDPNSEFRKFAVAGATVLGDTSQQGRIISTVDRPRQPTRANRRGRRSPVLTTKNETFRCYRIRSRVTAGLSGRCDSPAQSAIPIPPNSGVNWRPAAPR